MTYAHQQDNQDEETCESLRTRPRMMYFLLYGPCRSLDGLASPESAEAERSEVSRLSSRVNHNERSHVTAYLSLDSRGMRVMIVVVMIIVALVLHRQGQDLATTLVLAAITLGFAADVSHRIIPKEAR